MHAVTVVGPDAEAAADRLAAVLPGRVALVSSLETPPDGDVTRVGVHQEGSTRTAPGEATLADALDDLAPDHDYALCVGFEDARLPAVRLGDATVVGPVVLDLPTASDVDEGAVDAIDATEPHETLGSLVARVERSPAAEYAGAIATFTGRVRAREDPEDERTEYLEFEKYEGVAAEVTQRICRELEERDGVLEVRMHHRTGVIPDGEDIVFVVVLAGHRGEAFRTVSDGIDRLKDEVPIFKKEVTGEETFWVHERE